jgi:hypothetical protein
MSAAADESARSSVWQAMAYLRRDVRAALKEQRDAVGEAVHGDARLGVPPAEAHPRLDDERMALECDGAVLVGSDELGA